MLQPNKYIIDPQLRESRITQRLRDDYIYLSNLYDVVGIFVFGSQNYNTDLPTSDIDTKAIVLPKAENILLGKYEIKETHVRPYGELTVFDIKSMQDNIKKLNINFLEILFTDYRIIAPRYKDLWYHMITMREDIAYHNKQAAMKCIYGCAQNKFDKLFHKVPSNEARIEEAGYDYKAWSDILRFWSMMHMYKDHKPYQNILQLETLDKDAYDHFLKVKNYEYICTPQEIKEDFAAMKQNMEFFMDKYIEETSSIANQHVVDMIDDITLDCLKAYVNERCYEERWPILSY